MTDLIDHATIDEHDDDVAAAHPLFRGAPKSVAFAKLRKRLVRQTRAALDDFGMVRPGDRWLVCLSGGKDSYAMLAMLLDLKWRGLLPVDLLACNLDQAQPGFPVDVLPRFFESVGVPYRIERQDTYSVVVSKVPAGRTYCALCSRLRRGHLYRVAREEGCQAVVLGHHREDILETFFLNLFHGGKLAAMPPKLVNEEGDLFVLRPLAYAAEDDIGRFSALMEFPIIPCDLCGSQEGLQRNQIKAMLADWEQKSPGRKDIMLKALGNANPSHLIDRSLFDFVGLALRP
ncbi:MAG TPA: tRNA 2-thiocytidine(32) synthetase TtcA [Kaistia sp.]|nr:tRNA 2-thiocytidine(32) synthetase TtcA [Kaistia sp.]